MVGKDTFVGILRSECAKLGVRPEEFEHSVTAELTRDYLEIVAEEEQQKVNNGSVE